jgi:hypothetical protein
MIFREQPTTADHIRAACAMFDEGLRVEYKSTFDESVKKKLPKIVSSFANSQGGVLIVGVRTDKGIPRPPFEGFEATGREEYPLTIESICIKGIHPPVFPRTTVVKDGTRTFLVVEVEESGEAPHAIENSRMVYVRTGNASEPYDLATVDGIIDLVKRRKEPLEFRNRILANAEQRADRRGANSYFSISLCPTYPRSPLCSSTETWDVLHRMQFSDQVLVPPNSIRRVPDGAISSVQDREQPAWVAQYFELNRFGLLFALRVFAKTDWAYQGPGKKDARKQLHFGDFFQTLLRLAHCTRTFYGQHGYRGNLMLQVSLHHVLGESMRFIDPSFMEVDSPSDFECHTADVLVQRYGTVDELLSSGSAILLDILTEVTWAFWQSSGDFPLDRLQKLIETKRREYGL